MSKPLWEKGEKVRDEVLRFTVGNDATLDLKLLAWDALASAAHAKMLGSIDVLEESEVETLCKLLRDVYDKAKQGQFSIPSGVEDGHSAIENFLVAEAGDVGKKIHTGRSRNDQVLVAVRLYQRAELLSILELLIELAKVFELRIEKNGSTHMPGYTHMQQAMPASVGMWLGSYYEALLELVKEGLFLFELLGNNPLGAASGFGVPLNLDRSATAELLKFDGVQRNPIDVQNSRGKYEQKFIRFAVDCARVIEKFACDVLIYGTKEFGFFRLPVDLTTGSSIMPQKHNPDILELLRGRSAALRGVEQEISEVISKLPSHYHRDFQCTKEPLMRAVSEISAILLAGQLVVSELIVEEGKLEAQRSPELYATYEAYAEVRKGMAFRDAYRNAAEKLSQGKIDVLKLKGDFRIIAAELKDSHREAKKELSRLNKKVGELKDKALPVPEEVFGVC